MNKIFKVIWDASTGTYKVASETAKSRGKKTGRRKLVLSALVGLSSLVSAGNVLANTGNDTGTGVTETGAIPGTGWIAIGTGVTANTFTGVDGASAALGYYSSAMGLWSTAIGSYSNSDGDASLALGVKANASGDRSISMGASSTASGSYSMALGVLTKATGADSVALGNGANATGSSAIALGHNANANAIDSIAIGNGATASGDQSISLGKNAEVTALNSVALGDGSSAVEDNTVSVGNTTTQRRITNVDKGVINSSSTDAVNGSQLYNLSSSVATRLGGGASVNVNGSVNAPKYVLSHGTYNNVGDALSAVDTSVTNISEDALLWNDTTSAFSAAHGTNTTNKITNVAAGTLAATSTDAVNGAQLFATNQDVAKNTTDITTLNNTVTNIDNSITGLTDNALLWDATANAYSAAHGTDATSKITNVAAGTLAANSTDAVNGAQLFATNQDVAKNTTDITTLNNTVTNIDNSITGLTDNALLWDATANAYSAAHGTDASSKITNVAAGSLASDSTDAVNGAQLYETNLLIEENSEAISLIAGDTSTTYITNNGTGVKYVRTNDTGLTENDAHASGIGATAVGYNAVASGVNSLALGQNSSSSIDTGIALGSGSISDRALTASNQATKVNADGTITIGHDTTDRTLLGALSLGKDGESYRQLTNLADGTESQDAVTVRQLQNAVGAVATSSTKYFHANSTLEDSLAVGTDSVAIGPKTVVNGDAGIGMGSGSIVDQTAKNGIAIGTNAHASYADSIALGSNSITSVGAQSGYTAYNLTSAQNSVGEFSVGSATGQRQITNVAAGSADTDAVNVAQLKVTDSKVAENTTNISNLVNQYTNLDNRVTTLETSMGDITVSGGSDYLAVNSTGDVAVATGEESVAVGASSTASAKNSVALGSGSVANEENTVSVGSSSQQRRITNVSAGVNSTDAVNVAQLKASEAGSVRYNTNTDGSVDYSVLSLGDGNGSTTRISNVSAAVNDTDAVNYAQLKQSVESANTYTDQKMGEMNSKIRGVEDKMSGGIASAMAMASLPQAYAPGASMTSLAGSTYNGETAVALGVSMVSASGSWVYKLQGTSNSQGDYSAAIGAGIQW